ncbi:DNA-directed RNA polymerase [Candidatus Woesearchaeota archaeon]|nr:DNA-directed RNA polymerase [Candidatus Woesearchaeota archaeon]
MRNDRGPRRDFESRGPREPREMHKATCSECGKECDVPFKPTEGRPVYCADCYSEKRKTRY